MVRKSPVRSTGSVRGPEVPGSTDRHLGKSLPQYAAPEVFEGRKYQGPQIDIWVSLSLPQYAAPEVFEGRKYQGPQIDIWVSLSLPQYAAPEVFEGWKYQGPQIDIWVSLSHPQDAAPEVFEGWKYQGPQIDIWVSFSPPVCSTGSVRGLEVPGSTDRHLGKSLSPSTQYRKCLRAGSTRDLIDIWVSFSPPVRSTGSV